MNTASPALLALSLATLGGCVAYTPGLVVELTLGMTPPPSLATTELTLAELLPCPGDADMHHHHHDDEASDAMWSMGLADHETALLTPAPGHYCDLRIQIEGPELAPRQAVLPLTCGGERVELVLDATSVGTVQQLVLAGASDDDGAPAHALERLLETATASMCPR